ncbi:serine hydrolase domain-containing protein [Actinomarinicola tropica]|uniref:Serine hydrolase n=1 Tax=Actinomarinicola tropica TaxID=2789776 RepID=A0A5Q2RLU8_9ACTN|nr:serine hydrolase domain-containing protein [Actinomarinicola tropica]QGG95057.1 serine hydrolase [Actinomarinicola tropica]
MGALDEVTSWPVDQVGAAAVLPDGSVQRAGDTDRRFPLASVTKPIVALALHVAVEEGSIGLDDPLGPPGSTVRHLLAHASGIGPDDDEVLAAPATRRIYSNRGFELLGAHLRDASGIDVATYVREAVLQPLAMTATALEGSPAHGAVGSVEDMARFAIELWRDDPTTVSRPTRDTAVSTAWPGLPGVLPGFGPQDANDWGLGFEVRGTKAPHWTPDGASARTFGHFGRSGSLVWVDPVARCALVVAGDRDFGEWAPAPWRRLGDAVLAAAT